MNLYNIYFDIDGEAWEYVVKADTEELARQKVIALRGKQGKYTHPKVTICVDLMEFTAEGVYRI